MLIPNDLAESLGMTTTAILDLFWAIYPPNLETVAARIAGTTAEVLAGPATDAERKGLPIRNVNGLAVLPIQGVLTKRMSFFSSLFGGTSYLGIKAALNAALADSAIEEIMLVIDSPGGVCRGLDEVARVIEQAREKKPVMAFIDGLGASAAYYLASAATEIRAGATDLVGCIGSIVWLYDTSEQAKKEGIKPVVVKTGEHKGTGIPGTEITKPQIAEMQRIIDFYGDTFKTAVIRGRKMEPSKLEPLADGRVWPAPEAVELGLVDRISTFEETVAELTGRIRTRAKTRTARGRTAAMRGRL